MTDRIERGRVWVLEDSALEAELARRALMSEHDVEVFVDGAAVLERVSQGAVPEAILIDWQLPGITGVEVCRVLRARYDAMTLPVLMLTGQSSKSLLSEALGAGANDYVTKPYDVAELIARVSMLVRTSKLQASQKRRARQVSLSAAVGGALTRGVSVVEIGEGCAEAIRSVMDASVVEIWTQHGDDLARTTSLAQAGASIPSAAIRAAAARDMAAVPPGVVALPLLLRDALVGVVALTTVVPDPDAASTLASVMDLLALGITRARFEAERGILLTRERKARAEAEAANKSKDDFLAMVSHELRTPLNAITGWTSLALGGQIDGSKITHALQIIDRNARTQAHLIDDLLDISRIVSGKLRLALGSVGVASVASAALDSVRFAADARKITLRSAIDPAVGAITGDPARVEQIIGNLLSNAIKFTPEGGRVSLSVSRDERGVVIVVQDTGQGITQDFLPHVFERFRQADGTITRSKGGLGLGLAIVNHIVGLHEGSIRADSDGPGTGATFTVVLPAEVEGNLSSEPPPPRSSTIERHGEIAGVRVLVVDDEPDARELMRVLLESVNVAVTTASTAEEAFATIRRGETDVVLSDISMPVEDGLSLMRRVRALPPEEGGNVRAVALTAHARADDRAEALRAGFDRHVTKPVEANDLLEALRHVASAR